jgi:hypothetical protein
LTQGGNLRYTERLLECVAFQEQVRSDIRNQTGGILRQESAGRDGLLVVKVLSASGGMVLEAWYDSLSVWRDSPEGRLAPDTEGLIGGRWRGGLSPVGRFTAAAVPFVPDEVAEIAELERVLDDFLPLLPATSLRPGEGSGGDGTRSIRRLADGKNGVHRYAWAFRLVTDTASHQQDTLSIPFRRSVREEGSMEWDPTRGPLKWERRLALSARVDPKGPIRQGIHTEVDQRVRVVRLEGEPQCR